MIDAVTFGEALALFVAQEAGDLAAVENYKRVLAGAEVNVAIGLARLGHRTGWISRVGDDPFGRFVLAELAAAGVDTQTVALDADAPTAFQLKGFAAGGDPEIVYFRSNSAGRRLAPSPAIDAYIAGARHVHLTGIPLALSNSARAFATRAVDVARAAGATISFDTNLRPALWDSEEQMVREVNAMAVRADWVLPGLSEGALLTGATTPQGIADYYLERGAQMVAVKNGGFGAELFRANGERFRLAAFAVECVDTVGAGDGFAAGLISAGLDGLTGAAALERAVAVGALATTSPGDSDGLPTRAQLDAFLVEA